MPYIGFMYVNPYQSNASRPMSIASVRSSTEEEFSVSVISKEHVERHLECYTALQQESMRHLCADKCYPFTRSCCPGYYCPLARSCMIPCKQIGSLCPSSNTLTLSHECHPLSVPQFGPSMGCGGSSEEDICPAGFYCPTGDKMHICPKNHFCRAGDNAPTKCSPLMRCPVGTSDPEMSYIGIMLLGFLLLYLLITIGYKWIRYIFRVTFERVYGETYAEWFEKNQDSQLIQYLGALRLSISSNNSATYSSVTKTIKAAFISTEGDNDITVQMVDVDQELPAQIVSGETDATDIIQMNDDEEEEVAALPEAIQSQPAESHFDDIKLQSEIPTPGLLKSTSRVLLQQQSGINNFTMDIEFNNLTMRLKSNNKVIVNNVCGRLPSGTITAVMGPSGSGKSSFLSALRNQAPYGKISGEIKINDKVRCISDFSDVVGYVPQHDIMSPYLTPREVLEFQADLRLSRQHDNLYNKCVVKDVLELLDIYDIRDSMIGNEKKRGISGGQKKRVNIGMELVAQPSILFLDEPTSGLDATTSNKVMQCLKNIAKQGVTVLVVIHQPRYCIFKEFDNLILLARGGKGVFVGKRQDVIPYFSSLGYEMVPNMNPADFILDVIQGEYDHQNDDLTHNLLPEMWETKRNSYYMAENPMIVNKCVAINCEYKSRKTASWLKQSYMTMKRGIRINTRQRMTILSDVIMIIVAGFIVGWVSDTTKISEVPQLVHGVILASSLCGSMISLRSFGEDSLQYCRYRKVGISSISYFLGQTIADFPWVIFEPGLLLFFLWPVCFPRGNVLDWFFILSIGMFVSQGFAHMISVAVDKTKAPLINVVAMLIICFMNGLNPTLKAMSDNNITKFIIDSSYARWQFEALWNKELESWPNVFSKKIKYQADFFGFDVDNYQRDIIMLCIFGVAFRVITFLILYRK